MKKFFIQSVLLLVVAFGALYFFFSSVKNPTSSVNTGIPIAQLNTVTIKGVKINVELADTPEERRKGLGGRQSLASDSGMLFIFEKEGIQTFWMKGLKFPLDFIWIRSNKIVDITKNAMPPVDPGIDDRQLPIFVPREPVTKVLEVNGGFVDAFGIKVGDLVETK